MQSRANSRSRSEGFAIKSENQKSGTGLLFRLLQITITLGLIGFLIFKINWRAVLQDFRTVLWWWIAVKSLLFIFALFLQTIRWRILLSEQNIILKKAILFRRVWLAHFTNMFLPSFVGGDLLKIFMSWEIATDKIAVSTSVVVDRIVGITGLLSLMAIVGIIQYDLSIKLGVFLVPILSLIGAAVLLLMLTILSPLLWIRTLILKLPWAKVKLIGDKVINSIFVYVDKEGAILHAVLISIVMQLIWCVATYVGFLAFHLVIPFGTVCLFSILISIITILPISISGWGVREVAFILLFAEVGVESAEALSVALLGRVMGYAILSGGAIVFMLYRKKVDS